MVRHAWQAELAATVWALALFNLVCAAKLAMRIPADVALVGS